MPKTFAYCRSLSRWLRLRSLFGSDLVILWAIVVHAYEAWLFAFDPSAFGSIGMTALLRFFGGSAMVAAGALSATVLLACVGQWTQGLSPHARLFMLAPQLTLFLVTSFAAIFAVLQGSYADEVVRSSSFIASDQLHRIGFPHLYAAAIIARAGASRHSGAVEGAER